jgi:hypothetical protein
MRRSFIPFYVLEYMLKSSAVLTAIVQGQGLSQAEFSEGIVFRQIKAKSE